MSRLAPQARFFLDKPRLRDRLFFAICMGGGAMTAIHYWYNYRTLLEGGSIIRTNKHMLSQDRRLVDWYFHMIQQNPGYVITFQHQMAVPIDFSIDDDELLTLYLRKLFASPIFWPERRQRGLDEPMDRIDVDGINAALFRAPVGFDSRVEAKQQGIVSSKKSWLPWGKKEPQVEVQHPDELGDVVAGYFVHRRVGQTKPYFTQQLGGCSADDLGARSALLAPDPYEGSCIVASVAPVKGYCILRLTQSVSRESDGFPKEGLQGAFTRFLLSVRTRWWLTNAGLALEEQVRDLAKQTRTSTAA